MVFLNRKGTESKKSLLEEFFNELNILGVTVLLILFFIWKFDFSWMFLFPLTVLILITVFVYRFLKNIKPETGLRKKPKKISDKKLQRTYLVFLFLWLTSISAVPVVVYYFSIKNQEEKSWEQEILHKVAQDNIDLQSVYKNTDKEWFKRIQGNGIDNLNVSYTATNESFNSIFAENNQSDNYADAIYALLPDPITNWYNQPRLITPNNYVSSKFENGTLYFKKGLQNGAISINYSKHKYLFSTLSYVLLIFFVFIIIASIAWFLLQYLASVLLNLNQEKHSIPEISWSEILDKTDNKRILLNSFNGSCFLEKTIEFWKSKTKGKTEIRAISASEIIAPNFKSESLPGDSKSIIWISGFNQIINEFDKHENLLSILFNLNQNSAARIVVDFSFDIDLINEFYDEYAAAGDLKPEQLTHIFLLRKKWQNLFDGYLSFNGFLNQLNKSISEDIRIEDGFRSECKNNRLQP